MHGSVLIPYIFISEFVCTVLWNHIYFIDVHLMSFCMCVFIGMYKAKLELVKKATHHADFFL